VSTMTGTDATGPLVRPAVDAISIICSDLERSVTFYRTIGCDLPDPDGTGHLACDLGGVRLMLDTKDVVAMSSAGEGVPSAPGRVSLAARCATPEAVDEIHDLLVPLGQGSSLAPFDAFWGQRYATVLDPDGSSVDLYCDVPGATVGQSPP